MEPEIPSTITFIMTDTHRFGLPDIAPVFEFAASRLLAIRIALGKSHLVESAKVRAIVSRYLMWEGEVSSFARN